MDVVLEMDVGWVLVGCGCVVCTEMYGNVRKCTEMYGNVRAFDRMNE